MRVAAYLVELVDIAGALCACACPAGYEATRREKKLCPTAVGRFRISDSRGNEVVVVYVLAVDPSERRRPRFLLR